MQDHKANNPVVKEMQMTGLKLLLKRKLSDLTEIFPVRSISGENSLGKVVLQNAMSLQIWKINEFLQQKL